MATFASLVQGIGGKARKYMSNDKTIYSDAPKGVEEALADALITKDFLPAPEELVRKAEKEKITIAIDKQSLEAYKSYAKKHDAKYQNMINGILRSYAEKYLAKK